MENRQKERQELERKALQMLENPELLPSDEVTRRFKPVLHLWIEPTFTPQKHWIFYEPHVRINPPPKPLVREIFWDRQNDLRRLSDPLIGLKEGFDDEPRLQIRTIEIEKTRLEDFLETLSQITFPAFIRDDNLGLDGSRFGIETLGFYCKTKISWWSVYPKEWQAVVDWFEKTMKFLEVEFSKIDDC